MGENFSGFEDICSGFSFQHWHGTIICKNGTIYYLLAMVTLRYMYALEILIEKELLPASKDLKNGMYRDVTSFKSSPFDVGCC